MPACSSLLVWLSPVLILVKWLSIGIYTWTIDAITDSIIVAIVDNIANEGVVHVKNSMPFIESFTEEHPEKMNLLNGGEQFKKTVNPSFSESDILSTLKTGKDAPDLFLWASLLLAIRVAYTKGKETHFLMLAK